jgi:formylglycine-generating enzyme required for sulfatase activity
MKTIATLSVFFTVLLGAVLPTRADTFGSGANAFDIDFVTIGNPGNAPDDISANPDFAGSVANTYRIGQFEVSEDAVRKANAAGGLGITLDDRANDNQPATRVSWFEAAQFVNWLNTSSGSTEAYKFNGGNFELWQPADTGYNSANEFRNSQAKYFLPSADEWYKAAYHDASAGTAGTYFDYPTGSDTAPIAVASGTAADTAVFAAQGPAEVTLAGGASPYGTVGQGGNVFEWEETTFDLLNDGSSSSRGVRGGDFINNSSFLLSSSRINLDPTNGFHSAGFRVASIPEPSSLLLGAMATVGLLMRRRLS